MGQTPCQPSTVNNGVINRQIKIGRGIDVIARANTGHMDTWRGY